VLKVFRYVLDSRDYIYILLLFFLGHESDHQAVNDLQKEAEIEILQRLEISVLCKKIFLGKAAIDTVQ